MRKKGARLGQHFLRGTWAARALLDAAHIQPSDIVVEIGPGKGALTSVLLERARKVIAIEKDGDLIAQLHTRFEKEIRNGALVVVGADVRDVRLESLPLEDGAYILAANIPYYITGEILRSFLTSRIKPRTVALLVQKEVAERIARSKKESILSLSVKAFGDPRIAATVSRGNFSPAPSVDSAILVVERISGGFFDTIDEGFFFKLVKAGFSSKRKFLIKNISSFGDAKAACELCGIDSMARAEDIQKEAWKCLAKALSTRARRTRRKVGR